MSRVIARAGLDARASAWRRTAPLAFTVALTLCAMAAPAMGQAVLVKDINPGPMSASAPPS